MAPCGCALIRRELVRWQQELPAEGRAGARLVSPTIRWQAGSWASGSVEVVVAPVRGRMHVVMAKAEAFRGPPVAAFLALAEAWLWRVGAVLGEHVPEVRPFVDAVRDPSAERWASSHHLPGTCIKGFPQELAPLLHTAKSSKGSADKAGRRRFDVAHVRLLGLPEKVVQLGGCAAQGPLPADVAPATTPGLHCCCGPECTQVWHLEVVPREVGWLAGAAGLQESGGDGGFAVSGAPALEPVRGQAGGPAAGAADVGGGRGPRGRTAVLRGCERGDAAGLGADEWHGVGGQRGILGRYPAHALGLLFGSHVRLFRCNASPLPRWQRPAVARTCRLAVRASGRRGFGGPLPAGLWRCSFAYGV